MLKIIKSAVGAVIGLMVTAEMFLALVGLLKVTFNWVIGM